MTYEDQNTKRNSHRTTQISARVLLLVGGLTATALGCGWMGTSQSVRFNAYQTERQMGRLPPLPTLSDGTNELRVQWDSEDVRSADNAETEGAKRAREVDPLWDRVETAEKEGNLVLDRDLLRQYLELTRIARDAWANPTNRQQRRNSAIDRLDALEALDKGSKESTVTAYLNARRVYDSEKPVVEEIQQFLNLIQSDSNLNDNAGYLKAADLYRQGKFAEAAQGFKTIVRQYPQSEKREASLFMAAVATMKTSVTYTPTSGDEAHLHEYQPAAHPVPAVDKQWRDALSTFKKSVSEYPHGRYFNDANGWVAYLKLRKNDRVGALVEYYRMLADKTDENARIEATFSLTFVRHHASDAEISRVEKELERQPDAALAYAYHNIYNYAIDSGSSEPPYEDVKDSKGEVDYEASRVRSEELEKEWRQKRTSTTRKELSGILTFSQRLMERYPKLEVGGSFALRAAEASVELDNNEAAVQFATRAIAAPVSGDERAQALWIMGIAEHRLHNLVPARKSFETLLQEFPKSHLAAGAHRSLAMIFEDAGNIDGALEQYIALDYSLDIAYFVDVLMTPEELAEFIQRHADSPRSNEFTYALALRYLRANRWQVARDTLNQVQATGSSDHFNYVRGTNCLQGADSKDCANPKEPNYDSINTANITTQVIMRDIQTANDLEALERVVNESVGDEAKAEALYQFASYQYEGSSLLFYNPVAWTGGRYWNLSELAATGSYRAKNESELLFTYMQQHDTLARALQIYLEIASEYPRTRAAREALYTAAVCHERLANYNPYWREIYGAGQHAGSRIVKYADVRRAYPGYQLPRGTYGWQPSTRTVNGGPGWATPKPVPSPTKSPG